MSQLRNEIDELKSEMMIKEKKRNKNLGRILIAFALVAAFLFGVVAELIYHNVTEGAREREFRTLDALIEKIEEEYYGDINRDALIEAAIKGMFTELDAYSMAYTFEEYEAIALASQGQNKNFGFSVRSLPRRPMSAARVTGGGPAEKAGLKAGDEIIGIKYFDEADYISVEYKSYNDVYAMLTNKDKPKYSLRVRRVKPDKFLSEINGKTDEQLFEALNNPDIYQIADLEFMESEEYAEKYVYYYIDASEGGTNITDTLLTDGFQHEFAGSDAAYIRLTEFSGTAAEEFDEAMKLFKEAGKKRLILDLRGNPGGSTTVLGKIAGYLIYNKDNPAQSSIPVFTAKYKDGRKTDYTTLKSTLTGKASNYVDFFGVYDAADKKITVLVDGSSASASEALSSAIQDYGTGTLVGTTTYKKGIMQTTYNMKVNYNIDYYLKVTVATFYSSVTDVTLHGTGLTPQGENYKEDNYYGCESARSLLNDEQFKRALLLAGV